MNNSDLLQNLLTELRRGTLALAVLSQLKKPQYGYSLLQRLEEKHTNIEPGTLYPLLRRLESQDLLESRWDTSETRPRKYYVLSENGHRVLERLKGEWNRLIGEMNTLLEEDAS